MSRPLIVRRRLESRRWCGERDEASASLPPPEAKQPLRIWENDLTIAVTIFVLAALSVVLVLVLQQGDRLTELEIPLPLLGPIRCRFTDHGPRGSREKRADRHSSGRHVD